MTDENEYEKLRLDVLQKLIELRSIPYKIYKKENDTKNGIVELLKKDDEGKNRTEDTLSVLILEIKNT